jgi:hypothetical protein
MGVPSGLVQDTSVPFGSIFRFFSAARDIDRPPP